MLKSTRQENNYNRVTLHLGLLEDTVCLNPHIISWVHSDMMNSGTLKLHP